MPARLHTLFNRGEQGVGELLDVGVVVPVRLSHRPTLHSGDTARFTTIGLVGNRQREAIAMLKETPFGSDHYSKNIGRAVEGHT